MQDIALLCLPNWTLENEEGTERRVAIDVLDKDCVDVPT
jgi:hypothetical protein